VPDDEQVHVVVLCHANVARSVAAALLLREAVDERGLVLDLRTAGTHVTDGQPASARTASALNIVTGANYSLASHRARQLRESDVEWADLIIAMEDSQVRFVRRSHPAAADHVGTLTILASELPADGRRLADRVASLDLARREGDGDGDIEDPAGGDDAAYQRAMRVLVERCDELARRLAG
jgi:protein-tyrosine phosphatase